MKVHRTGKAKGRALLLLATFLVCLGAAEVAVRVIGTRDQAGNFFFRNRLIRPLKMPLSRVQSQIDALRSDPHGIVAYHPILGWAPRPGSRSRNGLYAYDMRGIRSAPAKPVVEPAPGRLRIALFGDSFTHGDDVPFEQTFGAVLERDLNAASLEAEVLNFGVPGYGIDQALLRFHEHGADLSPGLVVLGFQAENLKRDLNLLRPLYDPRSALPFAKPRFALADGRLAMVNVPVLPLDQVVPTLRDIDRWELRPYEFFYDPRDYAGPWWRASKLLAVAADLPGPAEDDWFLKRILHRPGSEEQRLGQELIVAFAAEAAGSGAEFLIVHLPTPQDLDLLRRLGRLPYQSFLDDLDRQFEVVHPEQRMLQVVEGSSLGAVFAGHYTALGNRIVAEALLARITGRMEPDPPRPR